MKKFIIVAALFALSVSPLLAQRDGHRRHHESNRHELYFSVDAPEPPVASHYQVDEIVRYIKSLSFDKDKLNAALLCVKICPIAADDLGLIVKLFSFDDNRVEFLRQAYPFCPDKRHYHKAVDQLSFLSSRDAVYKYIEQHYRD